MNLHKIGNFVKENNFGLGVLILMIWPAIGVLVNLWLAHEVPLTSTDLRGATWLIQNSDALHFSGLSGKVLAGAVLVMGLVMTVTRGLPPLIASACMAFVFAFGMSEESVVRIGLLDDTIRLSSSFKSPTQDQQTLAIFTGFPGGVILRAPMHMFEADRLKQIVATQRSVVSP